MMMIMIIHEAVILQDTEMLPLYTAFHIYYYNIFMHFYSALLIPSPLKPHYVIEYSCFTFICGTPIFPTSAIHPFPMHSVDMVGEGEGTCEKCRHGNNVNRNRS